MILILSLVLVAALAVQAQQMAQPAKTKVVDELTLPDLRSVLGTPMDDASGVSDFSRGDNGEISIAYHYYDVDRDNYETDFASEIAPRIQTLYKKFKNLDRVRFEIVTNDPATVQWKPFAHFSMDRQTLEKLHWTWFVARDILDQVLKNEK
jgi:opacity protein-like surface antigen